MTNKNTEDFAFQMVKIAIAAMEEKKAEDIKVIDIHDVSTIADYFLIASGSSVVQIRTICDSVEEALGKAGYPQKQSEGYNTANWILIDYGDVIIHIFDKQNRLFYDLERIWRDGKMMSVEEFKENG